MLSKCNSRRAINYERTGKSGKVRICRDVSQYSRKVPVKQAEITLAKKVKSLPETESDWTALHHLQHCCTSELTNFQASQLFKKFENEDDTVVIK